ncbi:MAG TPA: hypothetical protein VK433_06200, partial [Stellaceae bacterium]|nr:hypothetical protein [Stellaceae bacterium]
QIFLTDEMRHVIALEAGAAGHRNHRPQFSPFGVSHGEEVVRGAAPEVDGTGSIDAARYRAKQDAIQVQKAWKSIAVPAWLGRELSAISCQLSA